MGLFAKRDLNTLHDLLVMQLQELHDAEVRLGTALLQMADAAHNNELKEALARHAGESEEHAARLETTFQELGLHLEREHSDTVKGLIADASEIMTATGDHAVKDAALIAAAQRIEHFEIASYGTARSFANRLGLLRIGMRLQETLDEEGGADKIFTQIAEQEVNAQAERVAAT